MQGISLLPVIEDRETFHKQYVFSEYLVDNKAMIRDREWKYIFSSGKRDLGQGYATGNPPSGIIHRLYHLTEDPKETRDVAVIPENHAVLERMQRALLKRFMDTDPRTAVLPANLSVEEALVFFCNPPDKGADINAK